MTPINLLLAGATVLNTIKDIVKYLKISKGNTSLTEVTKAARVEPLVIIGNDCVNLDYTNDVMNSVLSLFTGYYLQAVALTTNISGVRVGKILDTLNPNTGGLSSVYESLDDRGYKVKTMMSPDWKLCSESYKYRLPVASTNLLTLSTENIVNTKRNLELNDIVSESSNLSIGKIIEVTVSENDQKVTIPITVRLLVNQVVERSLVTMLTLRTMENSFSERFHAWRAGRIRFVQDLILCQDMIDAHKKALMHDKEGVLTEVYNRSNNSKLGSAFTGKVNLASASNIYVISEQTASELESKLGGKLNNPRIREQLFESGYMMLLVVIDRAWERVTFYHRGLTSSTNLGVKDIKNANKGSGPDIGAILKAYQMGNDPRF